VLEPAHTTADRHRLTRTRRAGSNMPTNPYGYAHKQARKALLPWALGTRCPCRTAEHWKHRCDGVMTDPARMDLDHTLARALGGGDAGDRLICSPCNRSAGARLGNRLRLGVRASRAW